MMSLFTQRTVLTAGLATLALAIAPAAQAQIQVTGGVLDGDAAFFNDGAGGISMFDIGVNNLQIVSPNGVLTNPLFQPTATGGFTDNGDNQVSAGDTGLITGKLSGVGFTATGGIVPFSQVDTALAYQVSRFSQTTTPIAGTLLNGTTIPQLFIPVAGLTSSDASVTATNGQMEIGEFNSNLTAGVIDLPSSLEFRGSSSSTSSFFEVAGQRKIKFQFEGEDVTPTTFAQPSATELQFAGEANKKFKIQTFGDGNSSSFSLESSTGFVDITLGNVNSTAGAFGDINAANPLDYKINGQTNGILAMFAPGQAAVQGTGRNTTFQFTQGGNKFKGNTAGGGDVTLFAAAGVSNATFPDTGGDVVDISAFQSATSTTEYSFTRNVTETDFTATTVPFGNLTLVFNTNFTLNGSTTFETSSTTSLTEIQALIQEFLDSIELDSLGNSATVAIFTGEGESNVRYEIVSSPTYQVRIKQKRNGDIKIKIKVRNHRGRRVLLALQGEFLAGAFEQVGSGSRMFPGMVGLRQLSDEEAAEIYEELQLSEAEEGEDTDDTDTDDDDDSDDGDDDDDADDSDDDSDDGDDDADDSDDDDDADDGDDDSDDDDDDTDDSEGSEEDPLPAPVFEGLDDLSPEEVDAINEQINSFGSDETAPADGTEADATDDTAPTDDAGVTDDTAPAEETPVQ